MLNPVETYTTCHFPGGPESALVKNHHVFTFYTNDIETSHFSRTSMALTLFGIHKRSIVIIQAKLYIHMPYYELLSKIVNEYDQEIPRSQTADNPVAP